MEQIFNFIAEGVTDPNILAIIKLMLTIFFIESGAYIVALISKVGQVCGR